MIPYQHVFFAESFGFCMGTNTFVEIGPGKVLTGLVKRINKDVRLVNVSDSASARKFVEENITSIRI